MLRLSLALFLVQAGFHGYTVTVPLALSRVGRPDAEIGLIVGISALVQVVAALAGGALIDRFGGIRLFVVGGFCYLAGALLMLIAGGDLEGALPALIAARLLQGAGFGLAVPAGLSVVPRLVSADRRGVALATAGAAHNLTLVVLPPLSLVVLDAYGLTGVSMMVLAMVAAALVLATVRPFRFLAATPGQLSDAVRRFGFAFRRSWLMPLVIMVLFVIHWGVLIAYLPQRAEAVGANIGLFFAADGLFVLLARVPSGWIADRVRPAWPVLAGIAMTALAVLLLLSVPSTPLLVVAGTLTGTGAALIITPLMLALTERSNDADRGSAFALFSACFAGAIALGTVGTAPLIESLGFETLLAIALLAVLASAVATLVDRGLRQPGPPPGAGTGGGQAGDDLLVDPGLVLGS